MYIVFIVFLAWVLGPSLLDAKGFFWKKDLDVFDGYCNLELRRRYGKIE